MSCLILNTIVSKILAIKILQPKLYRLWSFVNEKVNLGLHFTENHKNIVSIEEFNRYKATSVQIPNPLVAINIATMPAIADPVSDAKKYFLNNMFFATLTGSAIAGIVAIFMATNGFGIWTLVA